MNKVNKQDNKIKFELTNKSVFRILKNRKNK